MGEQTRDDPVGRAIVAAGSGDAASFEWLFEQLLPLARRVAADHLRRPDDVEDAAMSGLFDLHRAARRYDPGASPGPVFARRVFAAAAIDRRRRLARHRAAEPLEAFDEELFGLARDPADLVELAELLATVSAALGVLPRGRLRSAVARHLFGETLRPLADELGVPRMTISRAAERVRARISVLLDPQAAAATRSSSSSSSAERSPTSRPISPIRGA